jgi:hypothetical protein
MVASFSSTTLGVNPGASTFSRCFSVTNRQETPAH